MAHDGGAGQQPVRFVELGGVKRPPIDERFQDGLQARAERGELVLDAAGIDRTRPSCHRPVLFQRAQLLDQHLLRYPDDTPLQITGPLRPVQLDIQEHRFPASGEDTQRTLDRQVRQSLHDLHFSADRLVCRSRGAIEH